MNEVELLKPVAFLLSGRGYRFPQSSPASQDQKERWGIVDEPLVTESQARQYAERMVMVALLSASQLATDCATEDRAKHAALVEAADALLHSVAVGAEADTPEMMEWIAALAKLTIRGGGHG